MVSSASVLNDLNQAKVFYKKAYNSVEVNFSILKDARIVFDALNYLNESFYFFSKAFLNQEYLNKELKNVPSTPVLVKRFFLKTQQKKGILKQEEVEELLLLEKLKELNNVNHFLLKEGYVIFIDNSFNNFRISLGSVKTLLNTINKLILRFEEGNLNGV